MTKMTNSVPDAAAERRMEIADTGVVTFSLVLNEVRSEAQEDPAEHSTRVEDIETELRNWTQLRDVSGDESAYYLQLDAMSEESKNAYKDIEQELQSQDNSKSTGGAKTPKKASPPGNHHRKP